MNKNYLKSLLIAFITCVSFISQSQVIITYAGNGYGAPTSGGYSGDTGPASDAELYYPQCVILDANNNIYISDAVNNRIRMVNSSGIISTYAGNGYLAGGFSGDGGAAANAEINNPLGITFDNHGNLYISDEYNNRIRMVNTAGIISTVAGTGYPGYNGDSIPADSLYLNDPSGVAVDTNGNIYIVDLNNVIQMVRKSNDTVYNYAGNTYNGYSGDGGPATSAEINAANTIALDDKGNLYIGELVYNVVRVVNTSGVINVFAGNGYMAFTGGGFSGDGGQAVNAELYLPGCISADASGNVYIADVDNNRIRVVNSSGIINTIAGNGFGSPNSGGFSGDLGPATSAELYFPISAVADPTGNVFIVDQYNDRIREITTLTNVPLSSNSTAGINVYPIPNTGIFTVSGLSEGQTIELYDYTGRKIQAQYTDSLNAMQFDISAFANGIYLIRIQNKDGTITAIKKIVKTQ